MIELKNLSFSYENSSEAKGQLRGIDLHVKKGELVILSGRSGCGKTTLTRILNGLCPGFYPGKLEGGYSLDGEDALKMPIHRLGTMVGSVFQDPRSQFFATNTTDEIVLGMENIPLERPVMQERLNTVCKQMSIERLIDRRIFPLSSGEKQLIAIASVCAMEPKVIVLDEPSANLDSEAMVRLGALLYRLKMAGHTMILSEHRFHYVRDSFDRLVFMEDGAISAVYDRKDALSLTAEQMTAMGLRPFDAPAFRVGGAYRQNQDDALQVSAISCMLDSQQILEEVSFAAQSGKILAIAGPNGAGKSTLCRIITGLYRAMGSVSIDGEIMKRKRRTQKSFFVQQDSDYQLYAPTVLDEFSLGKKETAELKETALSRLREMGLEAFTDRHPASLSGGQKQRLLLALAAASGRSLLVFDEPTSGLDGFNMHLTVDLLKRLAGEGRCILLITHDMELIAEAADSVLYIEGANCAITEMFCGRWETMMEIRKSGEDYLEAILILERQSGAVRSIDLARHMGYSKASISHATSALRKGGFLVIDKGGCLRMTDKGHEIAERIYERHQFFTMQLITAGVDPEIAEYEACLIEHAVSQDSFEKIRDAHKEAASVNSMLAGINSYLSFSGRADCRVKPLRVQRTLFGSEERELSREEYARLVRAAGGG